MLKASLRIFILVIMVVLGFTVMYPKWMDNWQIIYAELFNDGIIESPEYITRSNKRVQIPAYASSDLFPDENLYQCIKETNKKLSSIIILNCSNRNIKYLNGIEALTRLKNLNVSHNAITELPTKRISALYVDFSFNHLRRVDLIPLLSYQSVNLANNEINEVYFSEQPLEGFARFSTYNKKRRMSQTQYPVTNLKNANTYFRFNGNKLNSDVYKDLTRKGIVFQAFEPSVSEFPDIRLRECLKNTRGYSKETITSLKCSGLNNPIYSTQGINQLKNLEFLDLSNNSISSIELMNLTNLKQLKLNQNLLTNINLKKNDKLLVLELSQNDLQSLNFSNLQNLYKFTLNNPKISQQEEYQFISQLNSAKSVSPQIFPNKNFRKCIIKSVIYEGKTFSHINNLSCFNNKSQLFSLKGIEYLRDLKNISLKGAELESIDFSSNAFLSKVYITDSSIHNLSLPALNANDSVLDKTSVNLVNINLNEIKLTSPCNIDELKVTNNNIQIINFPESCSIKRVDLKQNKISKLETKNLKQTKYLNVSSNYLKNLNVASMTNLEIISIAHSPLNYNGVVLNDKWQLLYLDYNQLDLFRTNTQATNFKYEKDSDMFILYK